MQPTSTAQSADISVLTQNPIPLPSEESAVSPNLNGRCVVHGPRAINVIALCSSGISGALGIAMANSRIAPTEFKIGVVGALALLAFACVIARWLYDECCSEEHTLRKIDANMDQQTKALAARTSDIGLTAVRIREDEQKLAEDIQHESSLRRRNAIAAEAALARLEAVEHSLDLDAEALPGLDQTARAIREETSSLPNQMAGFMRSVEQQEHERAQLAERLDRLAQPLSSLFSQEAEHIQALKAEREQLEAEQAHVVIHSQQDLERKEAMSALDAVVALARQSQELDAVV